MSIRSARFPFQDDYIGAITYAEGVYALWEQNTVVFYGVADEGGGLRVSLKGHLKDDHGPCGGQISHFQVEPASPFMTPRERVDLLLREHLLETSSYPRRNLPNHLIELQRHASISDAC